jgi:hypothetical protein
VELIVGGLLTTVLETVRLFLLGTGKMWGVDDWDPLESTASPVDVATLPVDFADCAALVCAEKFQPWYVEIFFDKACDATMDVVLTKTVTIEAVGYVLLVTCCVLNSREGLSTIVEPAPCTIVEVLK